MKQFIMLAPLVLLTASCQNQLKKYPPLPDSDKAEQQANT